MNVIQFKTTRDKLNDLCENLLHIKGNDYSNIEGDRLSNFKMAAKEYGLTIYQAWAMYYHKHHSAISKFVREGHVESEPIEQRIADARNYLDLLYCLYIEQSGNIPSTLNENEDVGLHEVHMILKKTVKDLK